METRLKRATAAFDRLNSEFDIEFPQLVRSVDDMIAYARVKSIVSQMRAEVQKMKWLKRRLRSDSAEVVRSFNSQQ